MSDSSGYSWPSSDDESDSETDEMQTDEMQTIDKPSGEYQMKEKNYTKPLFPPLVALFR